MQNKKNKIKVLSYALALSLSTTSLTSCASYSNFTYSTNTEGEFAADGNIDYELLRNYKLIELKLLNGESKLYITSKIDYYDRGSVARSDYTDCFTGRVIYSDTYIEGRLELIEEYDLNDYLVTYDEIKGSYSIEDIERIYNKILEDYEFEKEKTLEK